MKTPRIGLYYKLFFVFGLTFLGLVMVANLSLSHSLEVENLDIMLTEAAISVGLVIVNALFVRGILSPLSTLGNLAKEFSESNFSRRVNLKSNDEISELASAMNFMADRIQNQMESLKHMAVGVSHEVRSPLARMRLAVEMLPDGSQKQILESQIAELDALTGNILEREALNSGLSELRLQEIEIGELLEELASHYVDAGNVVSFSRLNKNVMVNADRRRLEMCLKNLLDNAFHHGKSGQPVKLSYSGANDGVEIGIANQGKIEESTGTRRFGLGILLSESIAKAHGGSLKIESLQESTIATLILLHTPPGRVRFVSS